MASSRVSCGKEKEGMLRYTRQSGQEIQTLCMGLHPRLGASSLLRLLQGTTGVVDIIAGFILQPAEPVVDTFCKQLTGTGVWLQSDNRTAVGRDGAQRVCRYDAVAGGMKSIEEGLRKWTVHCQGDSYAIGAIADDSWHDLVADTPSWDWPFVSGGFGQGFALINRKGEFFLSSRSRSRALRPDESALLCSAFEVSVLLDFDREILFFEADGKEIPGSVYKLTNVESAYRFIASVPDPASSITFVR